MNDEELMDELRSACSRVDPVPESVLDNARGALLSRRFDEQLAELLLDSASEFAQVRGDQDQLRLLSFQLGEFSLEVQLEYVDERVTVRGLVDGISGTAEMDLGGERWALPVGTDGMFTTEIHRGAARFRVAAPDGVVVTTQWILV
ncbi:hypothetical protein [Actinophytocola oryzae]|uniref:Uncharacterized protein n=1 Tax=Actinophytocola oryzae TaxID=502181 RepID=A0A4R7W462_9PSEU|nr:hypothetical protein [Actinophytocola oryzae]TDV57490.1 hypothetical protein CLV71_101361 [Actinophytocola oryzae]